jgi:hypothetical protein
LELPRQVRFLDSIKLSQHSVFFLADSQHSVAQRKFQYTRSSNFKLARLKKGRAGKENFAYCRIFGPVGPYTVNILGFPIAGSNMQSASDFFFWLQHAISFLLCCEVSKIL